VSPRVEQLAANLWRWTTPHPLWREGDNERPGGWEQDVGSVLYARDGIVTIIDPLVTGEDDFEVWGLLDTAVRGAVAVVVALTASWHLRSSVAVIERCGGEIRLHRAAAGDTAMQGLAHVRPFDADGEIAPGVEALLIDGYDQGEVVYWLPEHAALVAGEVFQGRPDGLRIGPDPYLVSRDALYAWIRALDRLPVTLVLPAHGLPAPDGPDVIRRALERPPWTLPGSG
jgi:hypothetical protein